MTGNGLTLIIPIYNEQASMERLPNRLKAIRDRMTDPIEFILVDDGSHDGTETFLKNLTEKDIRVLHHLQNRGYGASIKTGIRAASYSWIGITDADETYPDDRIPELFEQARADDLDMLVGARTGKNVKIPLIRRPAKWFIGKLANYLARFKIPDINSGLRIFKLETLVKYIGILPDGFSLTTTITLAMINCGDSVNYVPIDYAHRVGKSKIKPIRDTLNFVQLIIRTCLLFEPLRIFIPVSLLMFLAAVGVTVYSIFWTPKVMDMTIAILVVGSIQILATGMIADMINRRLRR
ncbi:MAG: glycosyltransferase family 2 protein [Proteobacteria bacterium]|nr:glycosyltransferase family 2 protein [Pseudomonadota bacterium]